MCPKGHWNKIESTVCRKCSADYTEAVAVRLNNKLTPEQEAFHRISMPTLLHAMASIDNSLKSILRHIQERPKE